MMLGLAYQLTFLIPPSLPPAHRYAAADIYTYAPYLGWNFWNWSRRSGPS